MPVRLFTSAVEGAGSRGAGAAAGSPEGVGAAGSLGEVGHHSMILQNE